MSENNILVRNLRKRKITYDHTVVPKRTRKRKVHHTPPTPSFVNMAAPGPSHTFTPAMLAGIDGDQAAFLNKFLADQVLLASSTVRVAGINTKVTIPEYDPERITSASFFVQCENYFKSQGFKPDQYHEILPSILKHDKKAWYDSIVATIRNWNDFKLAFTSRYDGLLVQERRRKLLWSREQQTHESVEQFVHEMVNLARQVDPGEPENVSVLRAKNALFPELRLAIQIGDPTRLTINILLESAADAIDAIQARDKHLHTRTVLPALNGFRKESDKKPQNAQQQIQRYRQYRGRGRGSYYNGNGRRPYNQPYNGNGNLQNSSSNPTQSRFTSQQPFENHTAQAQHPRFARPFDISRITCNGCGEKGHFVRDCPNAQQNGSAMVVAGTSSHRGNHRGRGYGSRNAYSNRNHASHSVDTHHIHERNGNENAQSNHLNERRGRWNRNM